MRGQSLRRTHLQETVLEFPSSHPPFVIKDLPLECKPGMFVGELYPPRTDVGGVMLPSAGSGFASEGSAAERVRPDCVFVHKVGPPAPEGWNTGTWRERGANLLAAAVQPGDRIMVKPWSGIRYPEAYDVVGLTFIGYPDQWQEDAVMLLVDGDWRPMTNWVVLRMDGLWEGKLESSVELLDVKATVIDAGPLASVVPGQRVVCSDDINLQSMDDVKWLSTKWGEWDESVLLVREVDCDGVRRIVASLED